MKIDPDDLLNARDVASALGLSHREAVTTYRRRYPDFPEPILAKGTCVLWLRRDIEAWAKMRRKPGRPKSSDSPR
jgi:predicted DNA-binding transcriptional regulator AlpA